MAAPHCSPTLDELKRAARQRALAARPAFDPALGGLLARHLLAELPPPEGAIVSGYWPLAGEIDIRPLMLLLLEQGHRVVLPETPKRGLPLLFREWLRDEPLVAGRFGTMGATGPELTPSVLLVPLLAFDRRGHRLGFGAGYYDRTLARLPDAIAIGCAFAAQEVDEVPTGPYDAALDAVATETGVILCAQGR